MTEYQWEVILALSRLVIKIEAQTNDDNHEWFDINAANDIATLKEALERDEIEKHEYSETCLCDKCERTRYDKKNSKRGR